MIAIESEKRHSEIGELVIATAAEFHHRAVWVHPFEDGNGRWARLLANIWLMQHDQPVTIWPATDLRDTVKPPCVGNSKLFLLLRMSRGGDRHSNKASRSEAASAWICGRLFLAATLAITRRVRKIFHCEDAWTRTRRPGLGYPACIIV